MMFIRKVWFVLTVIQFLVSPAWAFDHRYSSWGKFLNQHVEAKEFSSTVHYKKALADRKDLDFFIGEVTAVSKSDYNSWSKEQKLAFLINSYNALTIKLVLDHGIPKSIKDIGSLFRNSWKIKFFKFLGEESHLDRIEHDLARKEFKLCRLHFAFNCASVGCPMLPAKPYLPNAVVEQMNKAASLFLADQTRNRFNAETGKIEISKIFDWYGDDFAKDPTCDGGVRGFVLKRLVLGKTASVPAEAPIRFLDYDWKLNISP